MIPDTPRTAREHGTSAKYVVEKCRCRECTTACREYEQDRRRRIEPAYVGADRARQHIAWLSEQGIGLKTIVAVSGVSQGALWKLVYGDQKRFGRPSKRIRRETEQAILSVGPDNARGGTREAAGPVWKIVDGLLAKGWTKAAIGRALGQTGPSLQLGAEFVTRANARVIRGLVGEPVPARRSRYGLRPVPQDDEREKARKAAEAERRAIYRAAEHGDEPQAVSLDESWRALAVCRRPDAPNYLFFPGRGDTKTMTRAKAVCARCPVHEACLKFALAIDAPGVWGGTSEVERERMRGKRLAS